MEAQQADGKGKDKSSAPRKSCFFTLEQHHLQVRKEEAYVSILILAWLALQQCTHPCIHTFVPHNTEGFVVQCWIFPGPL